MSDEAFSIIEWEVQTEFALLVCQKRSSCYSKKSCICTAKILGPYFFEDQVGNAANTIDQLWLPIDGIWYQKNYTCKISCIEFVYESFERVFSGSSDISVWRSVLASWLSGFVGFELFLMGHVISNVFQNRPATHEDLKLNIRSIWRNFATNMSPWIHSLLRCLTVMHRRKRRSSDQHNF